MLNPIRKDFEKVFINHLSNKGRFDKILIFYEIHDPISPTKTLSLFYIENNTRKYILSSLPHLFFQVYKIFTNFLENCNITHNLIFHICIAEEHLQNIEYIVRNPKSIHSLWLKLIFFIWP